MADEIQQANVIRLEQVTPGVWRAAVGPAAADGGFEAP